MGTSSKLAGVSLTTAQSAGHRIFVLGNIVAGGYYERAERPFGLSLAQWTVLRTVLITPGLSQADIAVTSGLNVMNVSRAVAGLRRKQLVKASEDPRNQRRKMLEATTLGESIGRDLVEREQLLYEHVFADLSTNDLTRLDALIDEVITRLAAHPPPEPPAPSRDWRAVFDDLKTQDPLSKPKRRTAGVKT